MSSHQRMLQDAYRLAIARTRAAGALLEELVPQTPLHDRAVQELARCMGVEIEAGRDFLAALDAMQANTLYLRRGRLGARRLTESSHAEGTRDTEAG